MFSQMWEAEKATNPKTVVRMVRGWKCPTTQDFFTEVGAAWQFPHSFPETWQGLAGELGDLAWWPADAYLFVVMRAVKFLDKEPASALREFSAAAAAAAEKLARPNRWRGAKLFRVVLQATNETEPLMRTRLKAARVGVDGPPAPKKKRS
jgi:hypothetical protein